MMRALAVVLLFGLLSGVTAAPQKPSRPKPKASQKKTPPKPTLAQRSIAAAQTVAASALDPALPNQPFGEWFQSVVGPASKVAWESNDCGEQTGDPATTPSDPPVCGQASARLADGRTVTVMIAVGTLKQGISGAPAVFFAGIDKENTFEQVHALSELPAAIGTH